MADFYGTKGPDDLVGTPFEDHFEGFLGYDTLRGGAGDDSYILDDRDPGAPDAQPARDRGRPRVASGGSR